MTLPPVSLDTTPAVEQIAWMQEACDSHRQWAEHLEAHIVSGVPCAQCAERPYKLDATHEREWERRYIAVIATLRALTTPPPPAPQEDDARACGRCGHTALWHANVGRGECQVNTGCDCHEFKVSAVAPAVPDHAGLYYELLYQVATKYPGETRHQTALRYIKQQEAGCACTTGVASARPGAGDPTP